MADHITIQILEANVNNHPATAPRISRKSAHARTSSKSSKGSSDVTPAGDPVHGQRHERHREPLRPPQKAEPAPHPRVMRLQTVLHETGLSSSTVYRMVAEHTFPSPVRLAARAIGWHRETVIQWLSERPSTSQQ